MSSRTVLPAITSRLVLFQAQAHVPIITSSDSTLDLKLQDGNGNAVRFLQCDFGSALFLEKHCNSHLGRHLLRVEMKVFLQITSGAVPCHSGCPSNRSGHVSPPRPDPNTETENVQYIVNTQSLSSRYELNKTRHAVLWLRLRGPRLSGLCTAPTKPQLSRRDATQ
jgi:hypothetical protein